MKFNVIDHLCIDAILGRHFLNKHHSIAFEMKGKQPPITISKCNVCCTLAAAKIKSPRLFEFFDPTCKPIASKSQFNQEDRIFIWNETKRLLNEGIIEPSTSPWRARVLVTKNKRKRSEW